MQNSPKIPSAESCPATHRDNGRGCVQRAGHTGRHRYPDGIRPDNWYGAAR